MPHFSTSITGQPRAHHTLVKPRVDPETQTQDGVRKWPLPVKTIGCFGPGVIGHRPGTLTCEGGDLSRHTLQWAGGAFDQSNSRSNPSDAVMIICTLTSGY